MYALVNITTVCRLTMSLLPFTFLGRVASPFLFHCCLLWFSPHCCPWTERPSLGEHITRIDVGRQSKKETPHRGKGKPNSVVVGKGTTPRKPSLVHETALSYWESITERIKWCTFFMELQFLKSPLKND